MIINTALQYRQIDISKYRKYNNNINFGIRTMKNPQEYINDLKSSKNLLMSPVAFIVPIITQYLEDSNFTDEQFSQKMIYETRKAQLFFSKMKYAEIESNKKLFEKEFTFADKINKEIMRKSNSINLKTRVMSAIDEYKGKN